jgi:hypothetical protein
MMLFDDEVIMKRLGDSEGRMPDPWAGRDSLMMYVGKICM